MTGQNNINSAQAGSYRKPRLLVLTTTFPRWKDDPSPPFVYELSRRLAESFEVTVHAPHYPKAEVREIMDDIRIVRFRYFPEPFEKLAGNTGIIPTLRQNKFYLFIVPFFLVAQFLSFIFLVLRLKPHVIHAHWVIPQGILATFGQLVFKIPFVVTAHGTDIFSMKGELFQWLKRFVIVRAKEVTTVSSSLAEKIHEVADIPMDKIHILPMGVSSTVFTPTARDPSVLEGFDTGGPVLIYVGRLSRVKGVTYLINAMPDVLSVIPDAILLIIGHGELGEALIAQVKRLNLGKRVFFIGPVPNKILPAYYATADIFIGPSIHTDKEGVEGFGITFVEAGMSGCLVIGTDVGGIGDIIEDGETGFLVPEKDSGALAKKIIYAIRNDTEIESVIARATQKCIDNFDMEVLAKEYAKLLYYAASGEPG